MGPRPHIWIETHQHQHSNTYPLNRFINVLSNAWSFVFIKRNNNTSNKLCSNTTYPYIHVTHTKWIHTYKERYAEKKEKEKERERDTLIKWETYTSLCVIWNLTANRTFGPCDTKHVIFIASMTLSSWLITIVPTFTWRVRTSACFPTACV
jgi:hypothetical protein